MAHAFLTPENISKRWQDSKTYTDQLTSPFPEFQRIARNEPYDGADPNYPNVTDGTTASIIQKTPKRVVQQIPTGVVKNDGNDDWLNIVAEFIFLNKIIPYANEDYGLFEKAQLVIENGLTFGSAVSYTPFLNHDGYLCPDMTLPYWGDIYLQRGKKSGRSCSFIFIRSWWQKEDIEALIESEEKLAKQAKARGEKYESTWDIKELKAVSEGSTVKDQQAATPTETERSTSESAIELVTGFQKGVGAKFYTFNPSSKRVVRTKVNKDPRGKMPLDWFFGDIDGTNPFGRGIVELLGGLQNLIDSDMQAYQYNRALALQPPVIKYGNVGNFRFEPNAVLDARNDPNAKIVPLTVDTSALVNYPQLYGLQKSQLLNLVSSPDTSISAEIGNPGFSKTPTGINQQKANISVDDNAIRKQFETWFESWAETAINIYFAERTGTEILTLDKKTADKLRDLAKEGKFDETMLNEKNELIIDYETETPALKFRVDASTSKLADEQAQLSGLELLGNSLDSSPVLQGVVPPEKVLAMWNRMVSLSGIEDPEDLSVDVEDFIKKRAEAQAMAQQQASQQQQMQDQAQLPAQAGAPPESPIGPEDQAVIQQLQQLGVPDAVISWAIDMFNQGATPDEVMQALAQTQGGQ